jgi:hypothetical protein
MSRYEQIIFLEEQSVNHDSAAEALRLYDEESTHAAIEYLMQWHYPGEHATRNEPGAGTADDVTEGEGDQAGYILSVNNGLGYIGLEYDTEYQAPAAEPDTLPDAFFKDLDPAEVESFKQWARDNHSKGDAINGCWHPIIRDECARLDSAAA